MEPAFLRIEECAKIIALGRSKTYELITRGEIPSVRIGRSVRVPGAALKAWVEQKSAEAGISSVHPG